MNLAPTASTTVAMAIGDALAVVWMERKGISSNDFALNHPSGKLGRKLTLKAVDILKPSNELKPLFTFSSFIDVLTSPTIVSIASNKLNDPFYRFLPPDKPNYVLQYYNARSSGQKLDLHIDSHIPFSGSFTNMMQFVILLEDSTIDNGCTTVVPGSHQSAKFTDREFKNLKPLEGKAGDLILWDSRLWHGTNENITGDSRWALIATLSMWWIKPSMDIVRGMSEDIYDKCSDHQKQFLGFCSIPPINPMDRNNTKTGYDFLKKKFKDYNF